MVVDSSRVKGFIYVGREAQDSREKGKVDLEIAGKNPLTRSHLNGSIQPNQPKELDSTEQNSLPAVLTAKRPQTHPDLGTAGGRVVVIVHDNVHGEVQHNDEPLLQD